MKQFLFAVAGLAALNVSSASAADLPARLYTKAPPPVITWNGFYGGIQGGGGWGQSDETFFGASNDPPDFAGTQTYDISGGFAGGVLGYNWQSGSLVFGIEGDYHWADINGRSAEINAGFGDTYFTKLRGFGDIKGRLGFSTGDALWFVSGGAAVGDIQHRYDPAFFPALGVVQNDTRWGWTIGLGAEYMFAPNWSAKIEYNYIDLGKSTIQFDPTDPLNRSEFRDTLHTVKAGINYHFNWSSPVVARY